MSAEPTAAALPRVAFIVGPTGAGKSALALALAERLGGEIVNGDSRQIYTGMDLGTAKPSPAERARVPHHLFDLYPPTATLDVAAFVRRGRQVLAAIAARRRPPIVVGGSGLYLRALRGGLCAGPPAAPAYRRMLEDVAAREGLDALYRRLARRDPVSAARLSPHDRVRIVRALEVVELGGVPLSRRQADHRFQDRPFTSLVLGLSVPRAALYERINRRFVAMVEAGLVSEVAALLARGLASDAPPFTTIGYREIVAFLEGRATLNEAIARAQQASRRLAKRQLTWFRADPEVVWLEPDRAFEHALTLMTEFFAHGSSRAA